MGFAASSISSVFVQAFSICILLFTAIAATEARPDFGKCWDDFIHAQSLSVNGTRPYDGNTSIIYQGKTYLHHEPSPDERPFIMSTEGCLTLCGSGVQYYPWSQIATTITTWVLPIIGTLLQAPYEGNAFRKTIFALVRWIGSPIASLAYILWNIKVIGKCAMLSDMSTPWSINFAQLQVEAAKGVPDMQNILGMRDSLYILSVMNQYTVKTPIDPAQAETLLRVALFADITTPTLNLKERRRKLAMILREGRKRGIVPVFVTLMWFLFSLAISIEGAFATLGENATAHDLALGLLLAWFPVLILSSVVDRNPTQTGTSCTELNKLLRKVQLALRTPGAANELTQKVHKPNSPIFTVDDWVGVQRAGVLFDEENPSPLASGFFDEFAGQGRVRWHYGVAHPILTGMESIILDKRQKESSRDWLKIPDIQKDLVLGSERPTLLLHFDLREFWEILSAFLIVIGTISGAFVLSFRTPTIGLGCRAGGYAIFGTIAAGIFLLELLTWYRIVAPTKKKMNLIGRQIADAESRKQKRKLATLDWIFRFCELVNTAWLIYIVMAQTIGSYQTCGCQAANWGRDGGYINAKVAQNADGSTVEPWWITGALLSSLIMFIAIAFLVVEWCEQSHLNSVDLENAMHGLKITQHLKYRTIWIRRAPDYVVHWCKREWRTFSDHRWNKIEQKKKGRETIRWSN